MAQTAEFQPRVPNKQYFRIGEVSRIVDVPAYVLRFWESEFPRIKPRRTAKGQRMYHRKDLDLILEIKTLLYDQKFTIKGARNHLKAAKAQQSPATDANISSEKIALIRAGLQEIRNLLK